MHVRQFARPRLLVPLLATAVLLLLLLPVTAAGAKGRVFYQQKNLVSDLPTTGFPFAKFQDPNLVNSWGLSHSPTGPWFISDNGTGLSTQYKGNGMAVSPLAPPVSLPVQPITIPLPPGSTSTAAAPTGNVFNSTSDFVVAEGGKFGPSQFIFATEDGTISGWDPNVDPTNAILVVDRSNTPPGTNTGAVYKGLAMGSNSSGNFLFAANFRSGEVDMFNAEFGFVKSFTDTELSTDCPIAGPPAQCFAPFNVQNIGGNLFVTFALQNAEKHDDVAGPGNGFVDVFDTNGNFIRRFASGGTPTSPLNSPWGLALAPAKFGTFSNDLLVGNFGDGRINAFDPTTGAFLGQLTAENGIAITINGLWGLAFGNGGLAGDTTTLFFASGLNDEADGLFGSITPA